MRQQGRVSVGSGRAGIHEALAAGIPRGKQHVEGARHVRSVVSRRIGDRLLHGNAGRFVEHVIHPFTCPLAHPRVADVALDDLDGPGRPCQILSPPGREIIQHTHAVAPPHERLRQVRADEPRTARH